MQILNILVCGSLINVIIAGLGPQKIVTCTYACKKILHKYWRFHEYNSNTLTFHLLHKSYTSLDNVLPITRLLQLFFHNKISAFDNFSIMPMLSIYLNFFLPLGLESNLWNGAWLLLNYYIAVWDFPSWLQKYYFSPA